MHHALTAAVVGVLLSGAAVAAPYPLALHASPDNPAFKACAPACTTVVQAVTARLGDAAEPQAHLTVTVGALERGPAPPGIGFRFGNPHPDLGAGGAVPQAHVRCTVGGTATPGDWSAVVALPDPTALERLGGATAHADAQRYIGAIADACARALRQAALTPSPADLRSSVVVGSPAGADAGDAHAGRAAPVLHRAPDAAQALRQAAPGDVVFEFGQRR